MPTVGVQSPNKSTISSLIQTLQQKSWIEKKEPSKLYDALLKMNEDLNAAYNALFFGPLPAVDGNALTNLNALNITGIIPEDNLPANIAFQDRINLFSDLNEFVNEDEESISIGFGRLDSEGEYENEPTSWFRLGAELDGEFFISQNFDWDGSSFTRDDSLISGCIIKLADGDITLNKWLPADAFDYPDDYLAETFKFESKNISIRTYEQDEDMFIVFVDPHWDIILLGGSAGDFSDDWKGHIAIPNKATVPVIDGGEPNRLDGVLVIDKTTETLCYYTQGARYAITGTPF
jgi:hypothetical protein